MIAVDTNILVRALLEDDPLLLPLLSLSATVLLGLLLVRLALPLGFMDLPGERKVHTRPTPRTGGLAMVRGGGLAHPAMALFLTAPISLDVAMGLIRRKRLGAVTQWPALFWPVR